MYAVLGFIPQQSSDKKTIYMYSVKRSNNIQMKLLEEL